MAVLTRIQTAPGAAQTSDRWLVYLQRDESFADRDEAYSALRAVLHALRDALSPRQAVALGDQLPTPVRMVFFEDWHTSAAPHPLRHREDFLELVADNLPRNFARDPVLITKPVFALLWSELELCETAKILNSLPISLRGLWPEEARFVYRP